MRFSPARSTLTHRVADIVKNAGQYHRVYYDVETFGGPSLYFHRRALEMAAGDYDRCLEYIYAVLTSWGMHRMGRGGSKMQPFSIFQASMAALRDQIGRARDLQSQALGEAEWGLLREIFAGIKVMATETKLVGNSKVMAHVLPRLVPPIDREYTLRYLMGRTSIRNGVDSEWALMREIIANFFIPVASDPGLRAQADSWMAKKDQYPWDTSLFKVIDNLVIGAVKANPRSKGPFRR